MRTRRLLTVLLFGLVALHGCGSNGCGQGGPAVELAPLPAGASDEELLFVIYDGLWDLQCEGHYGCSTHYSFSNTTIRRSGSLERCLADPGYLLEETRRRFRASLEAGRIQVDRERAMACYQRMRSLSRGQYCGDSQALSKLGCDDLFEGVVEEGAACLLGEDCRANAICQPEEGSCPGRCEIRGCGGGAPCEDDQYCLLSGECQDYQKPGEPCGLMMNCQLGSASCSRRGEDSICIADGARSRGERCDQHRQCEDGQRCSPQGACQPASNTTFAQQGAPCTVLSEGPDIERIDCAPGLVCLSESSDSIDGRCGSPKGTGELCRLSAECALGLRCHNEDAARSCQPLASDGEECWRGQECQAGWCGDMGCGRGELCRLTSGLGGLGGLGGFGSLLPRSF